MSKNNIVFLEILENGYLDIVKKPINFRSTPISICNVCERNSERVLGVCFEDGVVNELYLQTSESNMYFGAIDRRCPVFAHEIAYVVPNFYICSGNTIRVERPGNSQDYIGEQTSYLLVDVVLDNNYLLNGIDCFTQN